MSSCPSRRNATLVDVTHDVPPQDIVAGAVALMQAAALFPPGTIHVAVVDPDVGGARAGLVVEAGGSFFVGPDNGILSLARSARAGACTTSRRRPSAASP